MALEYSFSPALLLEAGPALLLAFTLNGVAALAIGSCYAELASAMPRAGGSYCWIKQGIGPVTGFFRAGLVFMPTLSPPHYMQKRLVLSPSRLLD
ncbi:MAG: amino acid permease [Hyphomicrobiales bacterium]|nr:amino acid permease [Hyphomicrobiales bacterium]